MRVVGASLADFGAWENDHDSHAACSIMPCPVVQVSALRRPAPPSRPAAPWPQRRRGPPPAPARPATIRPPDRSPLRRSRLVSGRPSGSATAMPGSTSVGRHRTDDVGQPDATRLLERLDRHPAQLGDVAGGPIGLPAHDGAFGVEQHDPGHAELGQLLDDPFRAIGLRDRECHRVGAASRAAAAVAPVGVGSNLAARGTARRQRPWPSVTVTVSPSRTRRTRKR